MLVNILVGITLFALCGALPHSQSLSKDSAEARFGSEDAAAVSHSKVDGNKKESLLPGTQVLDNPSYDPNIYNSFIPQDSVQQYVSNYGGPFTPAAYVPAFAVQSGYEGYLVPELQTTEDTYPSVYRFVSDLLPRSVMTWTVRTTAAILTALGVIFFGGAITTAICNLTQLCSLSFSGVPFFKWRSAGETISRALEGELTAERIGRAAQFAVAAIEKFSQMQDQDSGNIVEPVKED